MGKEQDRMFNEVVKIYKISASVIKEQRCFAYMATNTGDTVAYVNNKVLYPAITQPGTGDSKSSGVENGDFRGNITLQFGGPGIPIGANPCVEIVQLCYMD